MATEQTARLPGDNVFSSIFFVQDLTEGEKLNQLIDAFEDQQHKGDFDAFMRFLLNEQLKLAHGMSSAYPDCFVQGVGFAKAMSAVATFQDNAESLKDSVKANTTVSHEQKTDLVKSAFTAASEMKSESEIILARMTEAASLADNLLQGHKTLDRIYDFLHVAVYTAGIPETPTIYNVIRLRQDELRRSVDNLTTVKDALDKTATIARETANSAMDYAASASVSLLEVPARPSPKRYTA